jgi:hypothetical protein
MNSWRRGKFSHAGPDNESGCLGSHAVSVDNAIPEENIPPRSPSSLLPRSQANRKVFLRMDGTRSEEWNVALRRNSTTQTKALPTML